MKNMFLGEIAAVRPDGLSRVKSVFVNTAKTVLILAATILFTELLNRFDIGTQNLIMVYVLSVLVISCVTPTYVYGILAALVSTFAYDFLITEPRFSFSFFSGLPITLFTMLAATILASTLTMQLKKQAFIGLEREQRAELLHEITQRLLATRDVDTIILLAGESLVRHLERPAVLLTRDPAAGGAECPHPPAGDSAGGDSIFGGQEVCKRVHRIFTHGPSEARELFDDDACGVRYEPVVSKEKVLGVIVIDCREKPLTKNGVIFVQVLAGQVALALELQYLSDEKSRIQLETEREKMRSTLLRSISHDLRTPLTSILGASSTILEQPGLDTQTRAGLAKDIRENAQWLIRMVENILVITRISRDMKVEKKPEAAEEVVANAVSIVRKRYPDCYIHVHIPDELLIVPMDATLISQVIINLLENAVKNSPEGSLIILDLEKKGEWAHLDVHDSGSGIPESLLDNLFEMPSARPDEAGGAPRVVDSNRGMGIGLSICKTIIHAHGGTIEGHNSKNGGATFSFRLPILEKADA